MPGVRFPLGAFFIARFQRLFQRHALFRQMYGCQTVVMFIFLRMSLFYFVDDRVAAEN